MGRLFVIAALSSALCGVTAGPLGHIYALTSNGTTNLLNVIDVDLTTWSTTVGPSLGPTARTFGQAALYDNGTFWTFVWNSDDLCVLGPCIPLAFLDDATAQMAEGPFDACFDRGDVRLVEKARPDQVLLDRAAPELCGNEACNTDLCAMKSNRLMVRGVVQIQHVADHVLDAGQAGRGVCNARDDAANREQPCELTD